MPIYLVHGFRWNRVPIRHHIILNNVDGGTPEYIQNAGGSEALIESLKTLYPEIMRAAPPITFVEQYDPNDTSSDAQSQPYAYVCDKVYKDNLSIFVNDRQTIGMSAEAWGAFADLRDAIAKDAAIGWYVVYNGDEERLQIEEPRPEVSLSPSPYCGESFVTDSSSVEEERFQEILQHVRTLARLEHCPLDEVVASRNPCSLCSEISISEPSLHSRVISRVATYP